MLVDHRHQLAGLVRHGLYGSHAEALSVMAVSENGSISVATNKRIIKVRASELSLQGKGSRGVLALKLKKGETLV